MKVTIRVPMTAFWVADIRVPDYAIDNIAQFLDENPEYFDDAIENGHQEGESMSLLDAQIDPD